MPRGDGTDTETATATAGKRIDYRRETSLHASGGTNAGIDSGTRITHNLSVRSHRATA